MDDQGENKLSAKEINCARTGRFRYLTGLEANEIFALGPA
jgi:hypothetical protein